MVKGIIVGILLGLLLALVGVYYYFSSGRAPVAVTAPEMPLERKLSSMALHSYLEKLPHPNPQVPEDEANFLAGAKVYKANCAVCHGLPGEPKSVIAAGMFPSPPLLFQGMGVTDDEPWETYWKVANGIRMSGMPGFKDRLSDTQMWQVSVLVKNADKISPSVKTELAATSGAVAVPLVPSGTPATPEHVHDHDH
ncbi:MAG TPA: cytochrome c [Candidatus Acidoferrum sp.]|jgi:mono/diheme cytochrome c family protein